MRRLMSFRPRSFKIGPSLCFLGVLALDLNMFSRSSIGGPLYDQQWDGTGKGYTSQNSDLRYHAITYDNFQLEQGGIVSSVNWTGEFGNASSHGPIDAFTVSFWADAAQQPGALLKSYTIPGNAAETFLTAWAGQRVWYSYSAVLDSAFEAQSGVEYWVSIVPNTPTINPQWFWEAGAGGDSRSLTDVGISHYVWPRDLAFTLNGSELQQVGDSGGTALFLMMAVAALGILPLGIRAEQTDRR